MSLIIFPNQLFPVNQLQKLPIKTVFLIEDTLFFADLERDLVFNPLKLTYQRVCMKIYEAELHKNGYNVHYLEWKKKTMFWVPDVKKMIRDNPKLIVIDPADRLLEERIDKAFGKNIQFIPSLSFLYPELKTKDGKQLPVFSNFYSFYVWSRKNLKILVTDTNEPIGGKWVYDVDNRESLKNKHGEIASWKDFLTSNGIHYSLLEVGPDEHQLNAAVEYVDEHFPDNDTGDLFVPDNLRFFACSHSDAHRLVHHFLKTKLQYFGKYEDAIAVDHPFLFHSMLSSSLNNGLLLVRELMNDVLKIKLSSTDVLHSVEAFIRQLHWREWCYIQYRRYYERFVDWNYLGHKRTLSNAWYDGTTGFYLVDRAIRQAFKTGYLHHIQRLMVVCNVMNLCQIEPHEVYRWFMEFSLDSYEWVMIFNVYGMGCYAAGPMSGVTKPYVCSANYWLKMSNVDGLNLISDIEIEKMKMLYWAYMIRLKQIFDKKHVSLSARLFLPKGLNHELILSEAKKFMI